MPKGVVKIPQYKHPSPKFIQHRKGWANKMVPPKGYRYVSLTAALPDIVDDVLVRGMGNQEVFDKYRPLCAKPFVFVSLMGLLSAHAVTKARTALKRLAWGKSNQVRDLAKVEAGKDVSIPSAEGLREANDAGSQAVAAVAETMVAKVRAGAEKHYARVEAEMDKVHTVMAKKKVGPKTLGRHLAELDKFDQIGRRTYQMDDSKELTPQQWQVSVLIGLKPQEDLKPVAPVLEV